jgi:hypothetical protein
LSNLKLFLGDFSCFFFLEVNTDLVIYE